MSRREAIEKWIFGTVDRVIINGTHVDVADFKYGRGSIDDADINIQGQAYLLGVMDKFPHLETATVHFIIPRRDEVLTHDYTRADMEDIRLRISLIVEKAEKEDSEAIPNSEGCRYCKHKLGCPALSDKMLPIAKKYAESVTDFEVNLWDSYSPAEIEDPAVLGKMLNVAQVVDKWASAAKAQALKLAVEEGAEIPGYNLHYRAASLKVKDGQAAYDAVEDLLSPEEFMAACNVSMTALGKAYAEKLPHGEKNKARGRVEERLEESGVIPPEEARDRSPYLRKQS
jgi:hypothetical protein